MIGYEVYKIVHITAIIMVFMGLAGVMALKLAGTELQPRAKRLFMVTHGVGMVLALVAGFGLAARLGMISGLPGWVYAKIAIWLLLGLGIALAKRRGNIGGPVLILFIGLGMTAAWLAITKPF